MSVRLLFILCIAVFAVSIVGAVSQFGPPNAWMQFGIGAVAILVFFGILRGGLSEDESGAVRNAIAGSMIVTYLLLVVSLLFYNTGVQDLPRATEVLLTSFTTTIGIVIASYFGASAFIDAKKKSN